MSHRSRRTPTRTAARAVLACGLLLAGCHHVLSPVPVGEKPLEMDPTEWNGVWTDGQHALNMEVVEAEPGKLHLFWAESGDQGPKLESEHVLLRESGGWTFASLPSEESTDQERYLWGRLRKDDHQLLFWLPDRNAFRDLVEKGTLPGKLEGDHVILEKLTPEHMAVIIQSGATLFGWEDPLVLFRLGG